MPASPFSRLARFRSSDGAARAPGRPLVALLAFAAVAVGCGPSGGPTPVRPEVRAREQQAEAEKKAAREKWRQDASSLDRMALVPAGPFTMGGGSARGTTEEQVVDLPAFYVDIYEVSNEDYRRFVESNSTVLYPRNWDGDTYPAGQANHPATGMKYEDAEKYAAWCGKRLPTAKEWEKAARGTDKRKYPWGNTFSKDVVNSADRWGGPDAAKDKGWSMPVDSLPDGKSPFGCLHMAGNVKEWTSTWEVAGGANGVKICKGGDWHETPTQVQCSVYQLARMELEGNFTIGFRCVKDAPVGAGK